MSTEPRVRCLVFCASLRHGSLNGRLAELAARTIEAHGCEVDRAQLSDLSAPPYDADVQASEGFPAGIEEFHNRLISSDAFLITSPEYNAPMPRRRARRTLPRRAEVRSARDPNVRGVRHRARPVARRTRPW